MSPPTCASASLLPFAAGTPTPLSGTYSWGGRAAVQKTVLFSCFTCSAAPARWLGPHVPAGLLPCPPGLLGFRNHVCLLQGAWLSTPCSAVSVKIPFGKLQAVSRAEGEPGPRAVCQTRVMRLRGMAMHPAPGLPAQVTGWETFFLEHRTSSLTKLVLVMAVGWPLV